MSKNTGGPAFPTPNRIGANETNTWIAEVPGQEGMTLRDYFAAKAMQEILASQYEDGIYVGDTDNDSEHVCARSAYIMANAMLKAREAT
jgi:hypothetical protein